MRIYLSISYDCGIKQICSETSKVIRHFKDLKCAFIKRGYKSELQDHHFERAMRVD